MSDMKLPRLTKKNTAQALLNLAHIKFLKGKLLDEEKRAKAYLVEKVMNPGSKEIVMVDGFEVATISRGKKTTKEPELRVANEGVFLKWLQVHEPAWFEENTRRVLPEWLRAHDLERFVRDNDGELPPGLKMTEPTTTGGAVTVRMSVKQEDNYERAFLNIADVRNMITSDGEDK